MKLPTVRMYRFALTFTAIVLVLPASADAQRRGGSELDLLRSRDVLQEIGVTDEVIEQIDELRKNTTTTRTAFEEFKEEMRDAKTEEERSEIRRKIQEAVAAGGAKFQQVTLDLLSDEQRKGLRAVFVRNYGVYALGDDRVASDVGLSDEQRKQIGELLKQRNTAEQNGEASPDERDAVRKQWDAKLLAVLNADQVKIWKSQAGETKESVAGAESGAGSAGAAEGPGRQPDPTDPPAGADSVASFDSGDGQPGQRIEKFSFNFRYAPWDRVLEMLADGAGLTLDMQRVPPGSLTHLDHREYSATKALDIINGYLIRKGFGVVKKDQFLVVVNLDEQLDQSLIPEVTLEELKQTGDELAVGAHQIVTVRVSTEGLDTAKTAQEVEALIGPWGSMIALTQSQVLMITDIGANLRRIVGLLETAARPDEVTFKSYHLKHIDVEEAEPLLLAQFGMRQAATNVSYAVERRSREDRSRDVRSAGSTATAAAEGLQVASDVRTNSLFVTGTLAQHALVDMILVAIDVSETPDGVALTRTGRRGRYLVVYDVSSADVREVAKTLDAIMPGVLVNEDGHNGKLHIVASEGEHEEVAQLVHQLDGAGGRQSVAVIPLIKMDPIVAAGTLRNLFAGEGTEAPTIETDLYGRRLIIRGEPEQVAQIKVVLAQLGEDGSGIRPPSQDGLRRRYSLQGRSPDEFLRILEDAWIETEPNPIRIVVPARASPIRERRTSKGAVPDEDGDAETGRDLTGERTAPAGSEEDVDTSAVESADPGSLKLGRHHVRFVHADDFGEYLTVGLPEEDDANSVSEDEPDGIRITVMGDDLLLSSGDEEALDRLEELLDSLQQMLPYRTRWTVFYLQTADATETADMLAQIFPSSSVASTAASTGGSIFGSLANSFGNIGSSIADATGLAGIGESPLTLRIIPDVRSNSLLISGPESVLQDVWAMLSVLDSNDIPDSLRDMEQRTIPVLHADIDKVATIVRDVYKPLLEVRGGRQQNQNPFAAMMGGGGGNQESRQVQMTLGVDRQTSSLVVSSSQEIYVDVKGLVETLDTAAESANRTIRIVQLKNADPIMIQRSLTSLFPRLNTTVTTSRTSGTGSAGQQGGSSAEENRQRDAAMRAFRDRMQQMRGGSSGRGDSGRGGESGFRGFGGFGRGR